MTKRHSIYALLTVLVLVPSPNRAVSAQSVDGAHWSCLASEDCTSLVAYDMERELGLAAIGFDLFASARLLPDPYRLIPSGGLDPSGIPWNADRSMVGQNSAAAGTASDWTLRGAVALPFAIAWLAAGDQGRWQSATRASLMYAEAFFINGGMTRLGKEIFGRARPYAYTAESDLPSGPKYDHRRPRTFDSMPSGHSSGAWTGAALSMTEHLLRRPEAEWYERFAVGLAGGLLAGSTSALRVQGGQHFPTDVVAGGALGIVTGITLPMLHRGKRAMPSSRAWFQSGSGAALGALLGVGLSTIY